VEERGGEREDGEGWWMMVGYDCLGVHPPKLRLDRSSSSYTRDP